MFALRVWAHELAEHFDLDEKWTENVLIKTADRLGYENDFRRKYPGNEILKAFRPSLLNALESVPTDQVEKMFSQDDEHLLQLKLSENRWAELIRSPLPLQPFHRIVGAVEKFKKYLTDSTDDVINYGEPLKPFSESEWLQRFFTDCKLVPKIEDGLLSDYDGESDPIPLPPDLPSFAEIMERNAHLIKTPDFDSLRTYKNSPNERRKRPKHFRTKIGLLVHKKLTPAQEELRQRLLNAQEDEDFVKKEKDLRLALHNFSQDTFSYLAKVLKQRESQHNVILAERLVADCWNSFTKHLTPPQIDVLSRTSLTYFGLPEYPRGTASWIYGSTIHKQVFIMANLMEKIISADWDKKIQSPLEPIYDFFATDDRDGTPRFRCSYFQARVVCGVEKVDSALRAFEALRDEYRASLHKVHDDIKETPAILNDNSKEKEVAFLDQRAIERIIAMGGYVVFPADKRQSTLKEIADETPRPIGMFNDCEAYFPKTGEPIYFAPKQRAVIRFLFSRCDSTPKYSATFEEIIRDVCTEEEAKRIFSLRKDDPDKWRIGSNWFSGGHPAWQTLLKRVPHDHAKYVQGETAYYLDFDYENKVSTELNTKNSKSETQKANEINEPKKKGRGKSITISPKSKANNKKSV